MKNITDILAASDCDLDHAFASGLFHGEFNNKPLHSDDWEAFQGIRVDYGFADNGQRPTLLTPPDANLKLSKGDVPIYGLTLQSHSTHIPNFGRVNACPKAGRCVKVCVLNNGNGGFPAVQHARDARTAFAVRYPRAFAHLFGWETGRAIRKHGEIGLRPNVNSDVDWMRIIPTLAKTPGVKVYGYTKRFPINIGNYTEAYSLNENSAWAQVRDYLDAGINIAAVTNRKKGEPVRQWAHQYGLTAVVVDADDNDMWMVEAREAGTPVIGDLSAKGKARTLSRTERFKAIQTRTGRMGVGRFVQNVYAAESHID